MKKLLGLAVLSMLIFSCKQEIEDVTTEPESIVNPVELGEILENPYSVANMRKALDNLTGATSITGTKTSGTSVAKMTLTDDSVTSEDLITTTHYYLKFKPKTEEELDIIKRDTTLILFDFPLDVETSEGDGYRDPEVPDGQPTYKYTYAKVDHVLPEDVEYEVLEELFLPEELEEDELDVSIALNEEDEAFAQKIARVTGAVALETNSNYENILYALEDEALRITNNLDEEDINVGLQKAKTTGWFSKKWTPKGRISVEDDHKGLIPIKGIKV